MLTLNMKSSVGIKPVAARRCRNKLFSKVLKIERSRTAAAGLLFHQI